MKVARTKVKAGQDPVFDETFDLDDIPPDVLTFTVTVMNRGRRAKDAEVAEVILLIKHNLYIVFLFFFYFSNFSCMFLNPNYFFQFEF